MNTSAIGDFIRDKDKRLKLIVLVGVLGMVLIMLSTFIGTGSGNIAASTPGGGIYQTTSTYAEDVQHKLERVVGQIEGVGGLQVLVTIENSYEQVYAQSGKSSASSEKTYGDSGQTEREQQNESSEHAYVLIDASGGKREALLITQIEPKIKGVVVVCQGADNMVVQERVISAVTTALGISSNRVCVVKKA